MKFNHIANRVNAELFDKVVDMFQSQLGFVQLRRTRQCIWMRQPGTNVDLQLTQSHNPKRDDDKLESQVSFLSEQPKHDLEKLKDWLEAQGIKAHIGSYSDKEFYLDAPDAFVDFIIEAMLPELADYPVKV